jgi:hypothetical protein
MKYKKSLLLLLVTLLVVSMACSLAGGSADQPVAEEPADEVEVAPTEVDVEPPDEIEAEEASEAKPAEPQTEVEAVAEAPAVEAEEETAIEYDTIFPLPTNVQNFMGEGGDTSVNFQTSLSLDDVIDFYRTAFAAENLTERTLNTAITESTFSMVFDGHANGKALVIQGVDLGNDTTNVNIRFEEI